MTTQQPREQHIVTLHHQPVSISGSSAHGCQHAIHAGNTTLNLDTDTLIALVDAGSARLTKVLPGANLAPGAVPAARGGA